MNHWTELVAPTDVYTKNETDTKLGDKADSNDVYTKTETDTKLGDKADSNDVYTKTETDTKLGDKADSNDVYTKTETYTKTEINNSLSNKADSDDLPSGTSLVSLSDRNTWNAKQNALTSSTNITVGNVGIGKNSTSNPLEVEGKLVSSGSSGELSFNRRDTDANSWSIYSQEGDFSIYSQAGSGSKGDLVTIQKNTGNVGIGSTAPTKKLDVNGKVQIGSHNSGYEVLRVDGNYNGDSNNPNNHICVMQNHHDAGEVLCLVTHHKNTTTWNGQTNLLSFKCTQTTDANYSGYATSHTHVANRGMIEASTNGGVIYSTTGTDYCEWVAAVSYTHLTLPTKA